MEKCNFLSIVISFVRNISLLLTYFLYSNGQQAEKEGRTEIQKIEYLKNEKSFLDEIKSIFHSF